MDTSTPLFNYAQIRTIFTDSALRRVGFLSISLGLLLLLYQGFTSISSYIPSLPQDVSALPSKILFGLVLILIPLGVTSLQIFLFLAYKDGTIKRRSEDLEEQLTINAAQALLHAVHHNLNLSPVKRVMAALTTFSHIQELYARLGIRVANLSLPPVPKKELDDFQTLLKHASWVSKTHGHTHIHSADLAVACLLTHPLLVQWYQQHDLSEEDIIRLSEWIELRKTIQIQRKQFWRLENLISKPPIGLQWIYGFTPVLSHDAKELTEWSYGYTSPRVIGRKSEIGQVESSLCKGKNANVLLVGQVGVGKKTIIEGCAERIRRGQSPLLGKRIFEISGEAFSQLTERNVFTLAREATRAGNIILAIHDIHLVGSNEESPQSKILQELAASNRVHVLATTDPHHYHEVLERNAVLLRYFTRIEITEPSIEEVQNILEDVIPDFESRHGVFFTFSSIKTLIANAEKYQPNSPFPEKTMDMLESIGIYARSRNISFITPEVINEVFTQTLHVPAAVAGDTERDILLNLERIMHERIVGQDAAVTAIARSLQRIRSGIERKNKPIGSFLFLGPTGVGKTETAKTLAQAYFGSEANMLRFDMSEYQTVEGVDRFLGSVLTNTPGIFTSKVRDNPFSVILLDELEKAYHDLLNLFLQVLDEGVLTDAFGDKVSFTQSIIIATSNAGSEFIRELYAHSQDQNNNVIVSETKQFPAGNQKPNRADELIIEHILKQELFSPELINRFDSVVIFHPLTLKQLTRVAALQLQSLIAQLKEKGYLFVPNQELLEKIVEIGYDPQFGARPMARAIQNTVETLIAQKILARTIQKGILFTISSEEITQTL